MSTQLTPFAAMAARLHINEDETRSLMMNTLMKAKGGNGQVSNEELVTFLSIANEYQLNPLTKEIYAFNNRGAIQPIVSIDGWLKIINSHTQFNGMEFLDATDENGNLVSVTCRIYRKDREHPTEVTEYMNECRGNSEPWKKWPARMLRHKATIQAARYAFRLSGIIDPDEAERYEKTNLDVGNDDSVIDVVMYPQDDFEKNIEEWIALIQSGRIDANSLISKIEGKKKAKMTDGQKQQLLSIEVAA